MSSRKVPVMIYAISFERCNRKYLVSSLLTCGMRLVNLLFNKRGDINNKYTHMMLSIEDDLIDVPLDPTLRSQTVFFAQGYHASVLDYINERYPTAVDVRMFEFSMDYNVDISKLYGVIPTDYSDFGQWLYNRFKGQWEAQINICTLTTVYLMRTLLGFKAFRYTDTIPEILSKLEKHKQDGKITR